MSSPSAVVCREIFDENSQPSAEEVSEYACQLGIDPESESHLLPLAKDGLMQALPAPWKAYFDEKLQTHYYYNEDTKKTQWEHPLDHVYRELVKKARDASMQDDTCASVQELLTSEENTKNLERVETKVESEDDDLSTDSEQNDVKDANSAHALNRRLTPLGRPPLPITRLDKKLSDLRISPLRRSIDSTPKPLVRNISDRDILSRTTFERPKMLFKQQSEIIDLKMHVLTSPEEENFSPLLASAKVEKGLPLTGKGNMFLKISRSNLPSPDTEKSLLLDSVTKSDPPKGILREKTSDSLQRKAESVVLGKAKHTSSFEEDKKSVRFKLENLPEPTVSPGSNSSSEQNDGQSSIISVPPTIPSPVLPSSPIVPISLNPIMSNAPINPIASLSLNPFTSNVTNPIMSTSSIAQSIVNPVLSPISHLSPLVTRPPLPPRIESPRDVKSVSGSEKESLDSESLNRGTSPRRRLVKPPPGDYIKPELFQKNFQKISDLVRRADIEAPLTIEESISDKEARPRSPMIPLKSKISINLMESIESETSIDSPDREFANLDLNDLDDSNTPNKSDIEKDKSRTDNEKTIDVIPQIKVPKLDFQKTKFIHSDSEDSKKSNEEPKSSIRSNSIDIQKDVKSQLKLSPTPSLGSDRSRLEFTKNWTTLSTFKPLNKPNVPLKTSDSVSSCKSLTSPRLDGVILSQGKSSSDNVVVVYQFESQEESPKPIKSPLIAENVRDMYERNKQDERRRLEFSLQKELELLKMEFNAKEKKMRMELQEELKQAEEKFLNDKQVRLSEQLERHRREMEDALSEAERNHKQELQSKINELECKYQQDLETMEQQHKSKMLTLKEDYNEKFNELREQLEIENERALSEIHSQLQMNLNRERSRMIEENRATIETLREEHTSRVTELRHDYRAEVERLRNQHGCHLEELRAKLAGERAAAARLHDDRAIHDKYKCLKEKYARLKHDVKMSIERRNKRREMSMTTGSETEKSNSHKANQSLERCKELNETSVSVVVEPEPRVKNNNPTIKFNDNETSYSESNAHKSADNNNDEWKLKRDNTIQSDTSQMSAIKPRIKRNAVAFREPPRRRRDRDGGATTDCQDSSDATTADEKPKETINGHGRRRCFTRLKSASTSRLNYSPKRGEGWSSPLESLRQQLRKLDDLEDQFPDVACQPAYSLRYPFAELGPVTITDTPELEFVRHRALVEREGMKRARAVLRNRRAALRESRASVSPHRAPSEEREATELEVALHRARALLGEKEIRLRHIERALRRLADAHQPPLIQEATTSEASSGSEAQNEAEAGGAVLQSLRALHADVRDIWRALDARRPNTHTASPETSSCNMPTTSQTRMTLSAPDPVIQDNSDGVAERAKGLRAWLQTAP